MTKLTIRQRIYLSLISFAVLSIVGFGSAIILSSDYLEAQVLEANYQYELNDIKARLKKGDTLLPQSSQVEAYWKTSKNIPHEFLTYGVGNYHEIPLNEHIYHLYVTPLDQNTLYLAFKIDAIEQYEKTLRLVLVVMGGLFIALCLWFGWWLTQYIAHPVSSLASAVHQLTPNDEQLPTKSADPELNMIENAIDDYISEIRAHLLKERQFSGMASHELRTPIATILATLDTFKEDTSLNERQHQRIQRLIRSSKELQFVTESLLSTVRQTSLKDNPDTDDAYTILSALTQEYSELYTAHSLTLHTNTRLTHPIVNTHITRIVVGNLIRNAFSHTPHAHVSIHLNDKAIRIQDNGNGLPNHIAQWVNQEATMPYKDMGLGLYIVKTLCEQMGWALQYSTAESGSQFRITLN